MADLFSYVERFGTDTFDDRPLTNVDAVIIAQLAYLNFPRFAGHYQLRTLTEFQMQRLVHRVWEPVKSLRLLHLMASTPRYQTLRCVGSESVADEKDHCTAMDFALTDKLHYVAFRGTQSSFRDWHEDFDMAYMSVIPAQQTALRYLEDTMHAHPGTYYVGGHSKGGSLAVYAFCHAAKAIRERIRHCFSLDAPDRLPRGPLRSRITKIVPQSTFVGILLDPTLDFQVVASTATWMDQHNPFTWITSGTEFSRRRQIDKWAHYWQHTLAHWEGGLDRQRIRIYVNGVFGALSRTGNASVEQFGVRLWHNLGTLTHELHHTKAPTRSILRSTTGRLLLSGLTSVPVAFRRVLPPSA